jgi:hypothetical protein
MTLDETLQPKLAEWRPAAGRQTLTVPDGGSGWAVSLTADRHDELGCLVWEMTLRRVAPGGGDLGAWAARAAERVTGLLEPLKVVEVDVQLNKALLRSNEPARRPQGALFYYEVLLQGTTAATVRRYQGNAPGNGRREQVAFALTHEALAKLARDLTADK